ncbi:MAG: BamA/OMP85 family outer membrane protein [Verrucomicrobiales bacterium]
MLAATATHSLPAQENRFAKPLPPEEPTAASNQVEKVENPAKVKVTGYGLFGNRELKKMVQLMQPKEKRTEFFDASFIEDAVLILFSRIHRDGYLNPSIEGSLSLDNGETLHYHWTNSVINPLPRPFRVKEAEFKVNHGVLFYFEKINFQGLTALTADDALHFFIETDALIQQKKNKIYTPQRLRTGMNSLEEALQRMGYENVAIASTNLLVQTNTGIATVEIAVEEGPKSVVRSIRTEIIKPNAGNTTTNLSDVALTNQVYSKMWLQDFAQKTKRTFFEDGYADATIEVTQVKRELTNNLVHLDLLAKVQTGPPITIGKVEFRGDKETHESMLRRRVKISEGDMLNPAAVENGRYRLARLGIFDTVELKYENVDETTRNVIYSLREGKQWEFSLLAGYGSYEQLRGGFDWEQYNVFGRGHHSHLRIIQSFKATSADYTYNMPELIGRDFDVFLHASGLRREEISFTREEFGGGAGIRKFFRSIDSDLSLRYNYQVLNAAELDFPIDIARREATVGAFIFDLRHDRRDSPLFPRQGYKTFNTIEIASDYFFGDVNYQRFENNTAYHLPVGRSSWINLGLTHALVATIDEPSRDLPFNKRFFPGGDSSIRGYQFGEAAPRDNDGNLIGAETFTLLNVEYEQGLTRSLSIVFFLDSIGFARDLTDYPFNETLFSVGGGFRWKTIIGPARLEYGYNLNPRKEDPVGTLHFSLGFPF